MRFVARMFIGLCLMAFTAGQELRSEGRVVSVPMSTVDPNTCIANGPIVAVTEHPSEPGVYSVRCGDGVVLTGVPR